MHTCVRSQGECIYRESTVYFIYTYEDLVKIVKIIVAHHIFGIPATINCANYVYFMALNELSKLNNPKMFNIYTGMYLNHKESTRIFFELMITFFVEELLNLHRGQGMELYWRDTLTCPSEEEFIEMVSNSKWSKCLRVFFFNFAALKSAFSHYVHVIFFRNRRIVTPCC